jgi:hypothetical protein
MNHLIDRAQVRAEIDSIQNNRRNAERRKRESILRIVFPRFRDFSSARL